MNQIIWVRSITPVLDELLEVCFGLHKYFGGPRYVQLLIVCSGQMQHGLGIEVMEFGLQIAAVRGER